MSPFTLRDTPSVSRLAGDAADALRLRILGTERNGQVVEISAPRCTLGSSPHCTVRLRAKGVGPLHCLILRGPDGYTIRSMSADTWLNGRRFREQSLRAHDRLRVGPLEFEVLVDAAGEFPSDATWSDPLVNPAEERPLPTRAASHPPVRNIRHVTAPPLDAQHHALETAVERLRAECQRLESDRLSLETERRSLQADHEALQHDRDSLRAERAASEAALREWQDERLRWERERDRLQFACQTLEATLAERTERLQAAQQLMEERFAAWEASRRQLQDEWSQQRAEWNDQHVRLVEASAALHQDVERLTSELTAERQDLAACRRQLAEERAELASVRTMADERCAAFERRLDGEREELQRERLSWREERTELETALAALRGRYEVLERDTLRLREEHEQLIIRVREVDAYEASASAGDVPPVAVPPQPAAEECSPASDARDLEPIRTEPSCSRTELTWLARQWAATNDDGIADTTPATEPWTPGHSNVVAEYTDQVSSRPGQYYPAEVPGAPQDSIDYHTPVSPWGAGEMNDLGSEPRADDLPLDGTAAGREEDLPSPETREDWSGLERLRDAGIWRDTDAASTGSVGRPDGLAIIDHSEAPAADREVEPLAIREESVPANETSSFNCVAPRTQTLDQDPPARFDPVPSAVEEDSIESYMQRLLDRVRGGDSPAAPMSQQEYCSDERTPVTEIDLPPTEPAPESPTSTAMLTEDEYVPRSQPPELNVNLAAMRELANSSRRNNLLSHARRTWRDQSQGKLLGSVAASAVAAASIVYLDSHPRLATITLLGGLCIASLLVGQAWSIRRRLLRGHRGDVARRHALELARSSPTEPIDAASDA